MLLLLLLQLLLLLSAYWAAHRQSPRQSESKKLSKRQGAWRMRRGLPYDEKGEAAAGMQQVKERQGLEAVTQRSEKERGSEMLA